MIEKVKQSTVSVMDDSEIGIGCLVTVVVEARWWVPGITTASTLCAAVYMLFATLIYDADALV